MKNNLGTGNTYAQMAKEKQKGDALREAATGTLSLEEDAQTVAVTVDELGRPMNPFRRFLRWMRRIFKGY
jgi:hypothetical protein